MKLNLRLNQEPTEVILEKSAIPGCFEVTLGEECFIFPNGTPMILIATELSTYLQDTNKLEGVN